ncbi:hypothetical protein ACSLOE_30175, partial [Escherichia coli]|uniref:hypothetical protein n=1 Tax=Escherichia coli TaxID=562 RepID=UPI003EE0825B
CIAMQPCESRRNCQPETAETDFFHAFGSEEDGDRSGKTEVQGIRDERLIQEREHELSLERERQLEIQERTQDGPSLGW